MVLRAVPLNGRASKVIERNLPRGLLANIQLLLTKARSFVAVQSNSVKMDTEVTKESVRFKRVKKGRSFPRNKGCQTVRNIEVSVLRGCL